LIDLDIFETYNSLFYFRKRFLQFAYSMGIPIISNDRNIEETLDKIVEFITEIVKYQAIHNFMLNGKSKEELERYINFNPPTSAGDFFYPILSSIFGEITIESKNSYSDSIWLEKLIEGESKQVYSIHDKWGLSFYYNKMTSNYIFKANNLFSF
jgi:hypothetical protein